MLLNGGAVESMSPPQPMKVAPAEQGYGAWSQGAAFTPAVWARGSGEWLSFDDTATTNAFGRTFQFNLDRDLDVFDFESGINLGKRDLFATGDILVFGVLGGFNLDYGELIRQFDFEGAEVGAYATYLNGGLFVDTLVKADFLELEPRAVAGFPGSLDSTTWGVRTDAGYRFGGFRGGPFIEPLATIAVNWADIDDFTVGGNKISFDDDANVRGRLGLRVGTSYTVWQGTTMEPFIIGSVWSNLSGDDNQATLTSFGTTLPAFTDELPDVWGEVSGGVNFFNPSAQTTVFAKVDVTFGDDVEGVGGKVGMRYSRSVLSRHCQILDFRRSASGIKGTLKQRRLLSASE